MISPARNLSYNLLCRIEAQSLFSDDALNSAEMQLLDLRDRHLTTEIVYGTLRWQALLDFVLAKSSSRPWQEVTPGARILLRMSLYQMWFMDRIPDHALVNDAVGIAKWKLGKGIDGYLNGVLRNLTRARPWNAAESLQSVSPWIRVSLPQWLWKRWAKRFGAAAAEAFALSLNEPPQHALRFSGSQNQLGELPFEAVPSDIVPDAFIQTDAAREARSGEAGTIPFQYQDEASQLIPHLLGDDLSGRRIWDACAAPGGKSAILSKICGLSGRVVASDLRRERILYVAEQIKRAGTLNSDLLVADAGNPAPFRAGFDDVLADVPCSGLGTLRRNPEIKWNFQVERFAPLQATQKQIIHNVSQAVRVGGRLLYSTCSTEPEENEQVVEWFLGTHPDFALEAPTYPPGIGQWVRSDRMMRTFPDTRLWDSFFAALLVRKR